MQLPNHCALQVTLLTLLKAYQTVLAEHGISEAEDAFYYRMLLSLSTAPGQDWWSKVESLKACSIRCSFYKVTISIHHRKLLRDKQLVSVSCVVTLR